MHRPSCASYARLDPEVEHVVQVDVAKSAMHCPPCGVPAFHSRSLPSSNTPASNHLDEPARHVVRNPVLDELHQPFVVDESKKPRRLRLEPVHFVSGIPRLSNDMVDGRSAVGWTSVRHSLLGDSDGFSSSGLALKTRDGKASVRYVAEDSCQRTMFTLYSDPRLRTWSGRRLASTTPLRCGLYAGCASTLAFRGARLDVVASSIIDHEWLVKFVEHRIADQRACGSSRNG